MTIETLVVIRRPSRAKRDDVSSEVALNTSNGTTWLGNVPYHGASVIISLLVASVFATILVSIDWELLRGYYFIDRRNYTEYFKYDENVLARAKDLAWYNYITIEYLWHAGIPFLKDMFSVELLHVFNALSFFCLFTFAFVVARFAPLWSVVLLVNPLLMTLAFDQMRMAVAFSLLIWAAVLPRKALIVSLALCSAAPLIHTSSVLFIALFVGLKVLQAISTSIQLKRGLVIVVLVFVGAFMSFLFGDFLQAILAAIGDRRADRYLEDASSGIKYTSFWMLFLLASLIQPDAFYNRLSNQFVVIVLTFVTFNLVFGGYSARFLAVCLPFSVIALSSLERSLKLPVIFAYVIYAGLQWSYWVR